VMVLYVAVTFAVFGNLPLSEIIKAQDYALAEAAKPAFGQLGFYCSTYLYGIVYQRKPLCGDQRYVPDGKKWGTSKSLSA